MGDGSDKVDKHLTLSEELLWYNGRLYIPNDNELRLRLTLHDHDSKVAGHWGQAKTLELMTRNWYWPKMEEFVDNYVSSCDPCQHNKSRRHKRFGLLQPLELAYAPWTSISMDFIVDLPESAGCTQIWVIVDRFTKMAHFIPLAKRVSSAALAKKFLQDIWRLHRVPEQIVSDHDSKFMLSF
jgi:hypothetical protein